MHWTEPEDFWEIDDSDMAEVSHTSRVAKFKGQSGDEAIIMLEQADAYMRTAVGRGMGDARVQSLLAGFLDQMDPYSGPRHLVEQVMEQLAPQKAAALAGDFAQPMYPANLVDTVMANVKAYPHRIEHAKKLRSGWSST